MTHLQVIILGIVEGLTEFLPVSSTAHIDIVRFLLSIQLTDFVKTFEIGIQAGAILAVLLMYGKRLFSSWKYFRNIALAFIPTAIIGFVLYKVVKGFLLGNTLLAASVLVVGGIIIILYERKNAKRETDTLVDQKIESLTVWQCVTLGVAQAIAVIPGVSRSGAVIIAGRVMGIPKTTITEFSFVLAIPTIIAATGYDLLKSGFGLTGNEWSLFILGALVAMVVAFTVIKWFLSYIRKHSFEIFGWYRIVFGLIIIGIFFIR